MRNIALFLVCSLYALINFYIGYRIYAVTKNNNSIILFIIINVIISLMTITTIATYILSEVNVGLIIGKLGSLWMGISLCTFLVLIIMKIINRLIRILKINSISDSKLVIISIIIVMLITVIGIYNSYKIKVVDYSIEINKASNFNNLKVVAISDLHLGYINVDEKLEKAVEIINKENPDIVVILGDMFDGNFYSVQVEKNTMDILNRIQSKYGTYLCWGNHDAGESFELMKEFVQNSNIKLLEDEYIKIDNNIVLVGRKDSSPIGNQGEKRINIDSVLEGVNDELPIIILDHQPSNLNEYFNKGDLVLSGHTHGGQVFPFNLITNLFLENSYGHNIYDEGMQIVVTSGLGTWGPPLRIGTNNEIISMDITFK